MLLLNTEFTYLINYYFLSVAHKYHPIINKQFLLLRSHERCNKDS